MKRLPGYLSYSRLDQGDNFGPGSWSLRIEDRVIQTGIVFVSELVTSNGGR